MVEIQKVLGAWIVFSVFRIWSHWLDAAPSRTSAKGIIAPLTTSVAFARGIVYLGSPAGWGDPETFVRNNEDR